MISYLQNVQNKSILEIARDLNSYQEKGNKGQLGVNEISGGTFTISNIGIVSIQNLPNICYICHINTLFL